MPARRRGQPLARVEIDFLILADFVQVVLQKVTVVGGGWTQVFAGAFPVNHQMGIAVGILVPWALTDETHVVTVDISDADGNPIAPQARAELRVGRPPNIAQGSVQRTSFALQALL